MPSMIKGMNAGYGGYFRSTGVYGCPTGQEISGQVEGGSLREIPCAAIAKEGRPCCQTSCRAANRILFSHALSH